MPVPSSSQSTQAPIASAMKGGSWPARRSRRASSRWRGVSAMAGRSATVRRDIDKLHEQGLARKVYGGISAIEGATGRPAGVAGYAVVWQLARTNLLLGLPVVVDAVSPVPEARAGWTALAAETSSQLTVLETVLADREEHRRRVEQRRPDMPGQRVPAWPEVQALDYAVWDEGRDGPRVRIGTADAERALRDALAAVAP